jgi:hypothetical protein
MAQTKTIQSFAFSLSLAMLFLSGCAYLTHPKETLFLKGLEDNQKQMQAQLAREEKRFNRLKTDLDTGRLRKLAKKTRIISLYGQPVLCRPVEGQTGIQETCIYRKPGALSTSIILLNLDTQDRLFSWNIQNPDK